MRLALGVLRMALDAAVREEVIARRVVRLVTDELGRPLRPEVYSDRFARSSEEAGAPQIRLHDARHTSVTLERAAGWPDAITAAWHGHDEAVVRRAHTHITTEDMRRHARGL